MCRCARWRLLVLLLVSLPLVASGCLTLRSARPLNRGTWMVRTQSSLIAPPPYLGALSVGRGMTDNGELNASFSFLSGALDEPGVDLEWFQGLPVLPLGITAGFGLGVGRYVIDPGTFLHASQVLSLPGEQFTPLYLQRISYDLDGRTRWEAYLGLETPLSTRLRLQVAGGSRDLWNRDQWVIVIGGGWMLGGER